MMNNYANYQINGQNRTSGANGAQGGVTGAIRNASAETGVDFNYLMQQAKVESGMNPSAKARTSSATGLYQFIDQTWLQMMKAHGAEHGYGQQANAIKQKANGQYVVHDRAARNEILNLRKDPKASSLMAAELASDNHAYLQSTVGKEPSKTDLYMAHFLGAGGASNFLNSLKKNPWAPAASIFPEAARSNRGVFYAQGRPLSLQQVYNKFEGKFEGGDDTPVIAQAKAGTTDSVVAKDTFSISRVELPEASTWSNPRVERFASQSRSAGMRSFVPNTPAVATQTTSTETIPSGFLSSPVAVMEMASLHLKHNDSRRYNA